jgi:hypothetical protein
VSGMRGQAHPEDSKHTRLVHALAEATAEVETTSEIYAQVLRNIPSGLPHPDGAERIRLASHQLAKAKESMASAHSRLPDFLDHGTVPEDLK